MITSADNPRIKQLYALLHQSKARRTARRAVLEGVHLGEMFLQEKGLPEAVFIAENRLQHPEIRRLCSRIPAEKITVVAAAAAGKITTLSQGGDIWCIIALPENPAPDFSRDSVLLENVQDPGNLGTILRTAAAAGVTQILCGKTCADVYSPKVLRAAMGAHFLLDIVENAALADFCRRFSGSLFVTALQHKQLKTLYELDFTKPCAWLFGNEGGGISPQAAAWADFGVTVPMAAGTESLNIAAAAAVCLFEQRRARLFA